MTEIERIDQLRKELHAHNHNYYILNAPTISDQEFDRLMRELQDLEAKHPEHYDENSPSVRVGSDLNKDFRQVEHKYPMLSLGNTYSEAEVTEFYERVKKSLNEDFEICCELKFDGTSISLTYEDGKLVQGVTRGDGVRGDDVTDNVKTIRSIPLVLQGSGYPKSFEIRGEILMPWKVFEDLNRERELREEPLFANPRNAASGTLKLQNSAVVASRKLDAYLYYLLGEDLPHDGHYENLQEAARWGFKISNSMRKVHTLQEIFDFISYWDAERKKSARGNRRNRAEGQLAPPAAQPGLHGQISPLGDSLQVSGRTCADQTGEGDLSGGAHRSGDSRGKPCSRTARRNGGEARFAP